MPNRPAEILKAHHATKSRRSKPVNGICITAAAPAYLQPSHEASPRHRHPNGNDPRCAFAHSNRALCHLSSGGTPSSPIQSSPRNTNNSAGGPSTGGRRRLAISALAVQPAPHLMLKPHLVKHTPQLRIRVRPGIGAARLLPPHIRPPRLRPIIRGSPLGSGERQQLGRSRCADQLCIRPGQVETRPGQVVRQIQSPTGSRPPAGAARRPALAARLPCPSGSGPPGTARAARAPLSKWALSRPTVVGVTGFEPATSSSEARSVSVEVED
jgi:hypothetical protein